MGVNRPLGLPKYMIGKAVTMQRDLKFTGSVACTCGYRWRQRNHITEFSAAEAAENALRAHRRVRHTPTPPPPVVRATRKDRNA
jgi:hypothetical protein